MRKIVTKRPSRKLGFLIAGSLAVLAIAGAGFTFIKHANYNTAATTSPEQPKAQTTATQPNATPQKPAEELYKGFKQYTNNKYGFSFYYPSAWRVEEREPSTATADTEKTELAVWLVDTTAQSRAETALVTVTGRDLAAQTAIVAGSVDNGKGADYRKNVLVNNKNSVKYTFPQSKTINREMYLFGLNGKTLTVQSFYEETNAERSNAYVSDFNKLINSLRLP